MSYRAVEQEPGENIAQFSARLWWVRQQLDHQWLRLPQPDPAMTGDTIGDDEAVTERVACVADFVDALGCHVTIVTVHRYTEETARKSEIEDRK